MIHMIHRNTAGSHDDRLWLAEFVRLNSDILKTTVNVTPPTAKCRGILEGTMNSTKEVVTPWITENDVVAVCAYRIVIRFCLTFVHFDLLEHHHSTVVPCSTSLHKHALMVQVEAFCLVGAASFTYSNYT
ncbi:hypothetical protein TNCV_1570311 [Trichonephila clavipes]|uniref:Uncharacterized protein n=1 Tax=Trichonephila clavipes TaxID=2585209 RepID=A0A8X6VNP9_TRICX|nr:hypothetical protein TNCV_1570311 [Trichonephila clavipes]